LKHQIKQLRLAPSFGEIFLEIEFKVMASLWIQLSRQHLSSFSNIFGTASSTVKFAANHYRLRGFANFAIAIPELIFV
jgi:hypothetical protein